MNSITHFQRHKYTLASFPADKRNIKRQMKSKTHETTLNNAASSRVARSCATPNHPTKKEGENMFTNHTNTIKGHIA